MVRLRLVREPEHAGLDFAVLHKISELSYNCRNAPVGTREVDERDEIVRTLKVTSGRVGGPDGAAARMGIKRTTLFSRMKKLGIDRAT